MNLLRNNITYIHNESFFPLVSLRRLTWSFNRFLEQLPEYLGSCSGRIQKFRLNGISLKYLPSNFFQPFIKIRILSSADWGLKQPHNDLFRGLVKVDFNSATGLFALPNLTDRVPALTRLKLIHLIDGNVAESIISNLSKLETFKIMGSCDNTRLLEFQGASLLSRYDASTWAVREIPGS